MGAVIEPRRCLVGSSQVGSGQERAPGPIQHVFMHVFQSQCSLAGSAGFKGKARVYYSTVRDGALEIAFTVVSGVLSNYADTRPLSVAACAHESRSVSNHKRMTFSTRLLPIYLGIPM